MVAQMLACAGRAVVLLGQGRLHLGSTRVAKVASLPGGHQFRVFRESSCDTERGDDAVTLAVWFHLRGMPPAGRFRRLLFERLCLVNTLLFAGFAGYLVKLWMVDPATADYAGLYDWRCADEAEAYGEYITRVLGPLSVPGSVGSRLLPGSIDDYLMSTPP